MYISTGHQNNTHHGTPAPISESVWISDTGTPTCPHWVSWINLMYSTGWLARLYLATVSIWLTTVESPCSQRMIYGPNWWLSCSSFSGSLPYLSSFCSFGFLLFAGRRPLKDQRGEGYLNDLLIHIDCNWLKLTASDTNWLKLTLIDWLERLNVLPPVEFVQVKKLRKLFDYLISSKAENNAMDTLLYLIRLTKNHSVICLRNW